MMKIIVIIIIIVLVGYINAITVVGTCIESKSVARRTATIPRILGFRRLTRRVSSFRGRRKTTFHGSQGRDGWRLHPDYAASRGSAVRVIIPRYRRRPPTVTILFEVDRAAAAAT